MGKTPAARPAARCIRLVVGDARPCGGVTTDERERVKALEREVRELWQANEMLREASAYFAQAELDRLCPLPAGHSLI